MPALHSFHYKMEDPTSPCALGVGCQEPHIKLPFLLFFLNMKGGFNSYSTLTSASNFPDDNNPCFNGPALPIVHLCSRWPLIAVCTSADRRCADWMGVINSRQLPGIVLSYSWIEEWNSFLSFHQKFSLKTFVMSQQDDSAEQVFTTRPDNLSLKPGSNMEENELPKVVLWPLHVHHGWYHGTPLPQQM